MLDKSTQNTLIAIYGVANVRPYEQNLNSTFSKMDKKTRKRAIAENFIGRIASLQKKDFINDLIRTRDRCLYLARCWNGCVTTITAFSVNLDQHPRLKAVKEQLDRLFGPMAKTCDLNPPRNSFPKSRTEAMAEIDRDLGENHWSESLEDALLAHMLRTLENAKETEDRLSNMLDRHAGWIGKHVAAANAFGIDIDTCPKVKEPLDDLACVVGEYLFANSESEKETAISIFEHLANDSNDWIHRN